MPYVLINGKEFNAIDDTEALRKSICDAMPKNTGNAAANKACSQEFGERYGYMAKAQTAMKYVAKKLGSIFKL